MSLKGASQNARPLIKVLQWGGILLFSGLIVTLFSLPIAKDGSIASLKCVQLLQTIALLVIPTAIVAYLWSPQPLQWLGLNKRPTLRSSLLGVLIILTALPGINLLAAVNEQLSLPDSLQPFEQKLRLMEEMAAQLTEQFMQMSSVSDLLINLGLIALLPALAEECTFRGAIIRLFPPASMHIAIWCSAILFSAVHMQFFGFLPRMLLGALFGYALSWSGSLWLPIIMHFTNNALATLGYYLSCKGILNLPELETLGTGQTLWLGILSLGLSSLLIWLLRQSTISSH